jgi:ABC-type uncharacterized transport system permease subunit
MPEDVENYDQAAKEFGKLFIGCVLVAAAGLLILTALSWGFRLNDAEKTIFALAVTALLVSIYVRLRRQYLAGYDAFWNGVYFDRAWPRAKIIGWADAYMDSDDDLGPAH